MRIAFTGGRDYRNRQVVYHLLETLRPSLEHVAVGDARGLDEIVRMACMNLNVVHTMYVAEWETHGRAAGPIRNKAMLLDGRPDILIAFPGGIGTENCIRQARELAITVMRIVE